MPIGMRIQVDPGGVESALKGLKKALKDLGPVRRDFAGRMEASVEDNFRAGGRPTRWKPSIRAERKGGKTLIKTARLKNSITSRVRGEYIIIGSNVSYAKAHQKGVDAQVTQRVRAHRRKPKNRRAHLVKAHTRRMHLRIPARPFLAVQPADKRYLLRIVKQHLNRVVRGQRG